MADLQIRKKSIKTWQHVDSVNGSFILGKFTFSTDNTRMQIIEEGHAKRNYYELQNITIFDDTAGGLAESFSSFSLLSQRLEELKYPAFYRDGDSNVSVVPDLSNAFTSQTVVFSDFTALNGNKSQITANKEILIAKIVGGRELDVNIDYLHTKATGVIEITGDLLAQINSNPADYAGLSINFKLY